MAYDSAFLSSSRPVLALLCALTFSLGGWACSRRSGEPAAAAIPPEENRFTRRVLVEGLDEPMQVDFDREGRVYIIERGGAVKRFDAATGQTTLIGKIPVFMEGEGGLLGILLDRDFAANRQLYLYYSAPGEEREARLSRFTLGADGRIDPASEAVMLRWPHDVASHMGGGMARDADGNLYLAVGENSIPTQYSPITWTEEGGRREDSQRTAANTNDLRGKILRIRPQPDGSYTIPEGNLFPPGTPDTRPEIYVMGTRNPWRLSVDSRTGHLHWGEIGPDAGQDSTGVGPRGYDEFNVAGSAGNYGWPYFIGYNRAYHVWDPETKTFGEPVDPARPVNASPNNTGLRELPPARPPLIAYPYGVSEEYPSLSSGGRAAVGGPVFRRADFGPDAERPFPEYYEGRWFIVDFVRNWIMTVATDDQKTDVVEMEQFLPDEKYSSPIDMDFGPEGDLYVLEYGRSPDGRLSRIEYNAGNRAPRVNVAADRLAGATPLRVTLSSEGTVDHDGDRLRYEWVVTPADGGAPQRFSEASPTLTLRQPGEYRAVLVATDPAGARDSASLRIVAGNEPPRVALELMRGNRSFHFPGEPVGYRVAVSDQEDGSLTSGGIAADDVRVTAEYVPSGLTPAELAQVRDLDPRASVRHMRALEIMAGSDCSACHTVDTRAVGPSFREVAERYRGREDAVEYLSRKIAEGSSGVWGEVHMPPHPNLSPTQVRTLSEYVMSQAGAEAGPRRLPLQGSYTTAEQEGQGAYVIRATYTDRGASGVAPLTEGDVLLLRYPLLKPETADVTSDGMSYAPSRGDPMFIVNRSGSYLGFQGIDLTGIDRIEIGGLTRFWTWSHFLGATVEVRLGSPTGRLVGRAELKPPPGPAPPGQIYLGDDLDPPAPVDVSGISGVHDVYFVFRNPEAQEDDALLVLRGFGFHRGAAPGASGR